MEVEAVNARDVLTCDVCRGKINEIREGAMLTWDADDKGVVLMVALVHKFTCDDRLDLGLSDELFGFAHPAWGLRRLMNLHRNYAFTAEQAKRLAYIAWAASVLSTAHEKKDSAARARKLMAHGLGL